MTRQSLRISDTRGSAFRGLGLLALLLLLLGSISLPTTAQAQPLVKSVLSVEADESVLTGDIFSYRLAYSCDSTSGPCLDAEVIDLLPDGVQFISTLPANPAGDVAGISVTPNFMGTGRTRVRFDLIHPLPAGNSGNLLINVRFPNGSTPDGTTVTNTADAINLGTTPGTYTTLPVVVTATASAQVKLTKTLITSPANLDMPETYQLSVALPNVSGMLNLTSIGPVVDTLPAGTVFNGASPAADCQPGCVGTTPSTITWTNPCAVPLTPGGNCDILVNVTFPSATFPSGMNLTNSFVADATHLGEPSQTFGPGAVTHPVTTFVANPSAEVRASVADDSPNPPAPNQTFSYEIEPANNGNVPLDQLVVIDTVPVEMQISSVTTGAYTGLSNFAASEGVRLSYEKNTALGVFTLWDSSPDTSNNTTLTAPPPGLGAGEYVTRIRWEYGQAQSGMAATAPPRITGTIINPDNAGAPVAPGDTIQNCVSLSAVYSAGPSSVSRNACQQFSVSGPFVQLTPSKAIPSGIGLFTHGDQISYQLGIQNDAQSSNAVALADLTVIDLLPFGLEFSSWAFDAHSTSLPTPQTFEEIPDFAGTSRTLLRWQWDTGSGNLGVNQAVLITITTSISENAPAGSLSNEFTLGHDASGLELRCSGSTQVDSIDLDEDNDATETLCLAMEAITVLDLTPPSISGMPGNQTVEATSPDGAVVTWDAPTGFDAADGGPVQVGCDPDSGDTFLLGDTTVTCSATDSSGNLAEQSFTITVVDTTGPVIDPLPNIVVPADGTGETIVTWSATATDAAEGPVQVICDPVSGSGFTIDTTTTVTCSASDSRPNSTSVSFTVTVLGVEAQLGELRAEVQQSEINPVAIRSIDRALAGAESALNRNHKPTTCFQLNYAQTQVNLYRALGQIPPWQAGEWIADIERTKLVIGC